MALAHHVAEWMTAAALAATGPFRVSLSGGSTPKTLYALLASDEFRGRFPWQRVFWYWGDERFVPYDHPESNYRMTREAMLSKAPVPPENVYPVPADGTARRTRPVRYELDSAGGLRRDDSGSRAAAVRYHLARARAGWAYRFAAAGEPVLEERKRWVVAVSHGRPEVRITMTYPVIESSRHVAFLVAGQEKAAILRSIRAGGSEVPAARVRPMGELVWFVDQAAMSDERMPSRAHTRPL